MKSNYVRRKSLGLRLSIVAMHKFENQQFKNTMWKLLIRSPATVPGGCIGTLMGNEVAVQPQQLEFPMLLTALATMPTQVLIAALSNRLCS